MYICSETEVDRDGAAWLAMTKRAESGDDLEALPDDSEVVPFLSDDIEGFEDEEEGHGPCPLLRRRAWRFRDRSFTPEPFHRLCARPSFK